MFERIFERALFNSRFISFSAVVFSMLGATILFLVASLDIWNVMVLIFDMIINHTHPEHMHEDVVSAIIGAVDLYLIAIVLFIFSFGVYELFISEIEAMEEDEKNFSALKIHSLDELKDKIAKVIVMVLVVSFFQKVLHTDYTGALEMLYFSGSILLLALALYFLHKGDH